MSKDKPSSEIGSNFETLIFRGADNGFSHIAIRNMERKAVIGKHNRKLLSKKKFVEIGSLKRKLESTE